jgi:hypothetical protein
MFADIANETAPTAEPVQIQPKVQVQVQVQQPKVLVPEVKPPVVTQTVAVYPPMVHAPMKFKKLNGKIVTPKLKPRADAQPLAPAPAPVSISMLSVTNEVATRENAAPRPRAVQQAPKVQEARGLPVTLIRGDIVYR